MSSPTTPTQPSGRTGLWVRAPQVLRAKKIWIAPLAIASVFVVLMAIVYLGAVINPTGHLHGLPVVLVNEDQGASVDGKSVNIGKSVTSALQGSEGVTSRLRLEVRTLAQAEAEMDRGSAYAALVMPSTLTRSALLATGQKVPAGTPTTATIDLEENSRLGTLGVNLAAGVLTPAITKISPSIGSHLAALATPAANGNSILAAKIADPVSVTTSTYRPLPDHSALGLSAFYIALLGLLAGFVGATLINSSVDSALGYASSQLGPRYTQRRPVAINRRQTFLVKWTIAIVAAPLLVGIVVLVSIVGLGMYAPNPVLLWALLTLASLMIATGTLALLAAFGSIGQLLAMILLIYLSLASSGGTVPIQALPGPFRVIGEVEPLRNTLMGTRAIMYFGARGDAGLTHSLLVLAAEALFWAAVGFAASVWYDHRKLDRIPPATIEYINRTIDATQGEPRA